MIMQKVHRVFFQQKKQPNIGEMVCSRPVYALREKGKELKLALICRNAVLFYNEVTLIIKLKLSTSCFHLLFHIACSC